MDDVERDAAEEEVGRAERRKVHLLEVWVPDAVSTQLLSETIVYQVFWKPKDYAAEQMVAQLQRRKTVS